MISKNRTQRFLKHLAGFRLLGLAFTLFFLLNMVVFTLVSLWPSLLEGLWLSADRPWGVVTSIFVQQDPSHLFGNLGFFLLYGLLFIGVNWHHSAKSKHRLSRIFLGVISISTILVNVTEFLIWWYPSGITNLGGWGASGLVFASAGALLAFFFYSLQIRVQKIQKTRRPLKKISWSHLLVSLLPIIVIFWIFWCIRLDFFGSGRAGVVHGLGFLFGFLGTIGFFLVCVFRGVTARVGSRRRGSKGTVTLTILGATIGILYGGLGFIIGVPIATLLMISVILIAVSTKFIKVVQC